MLIFSFSIDQVAAPLTHTVATDFLSGLLFLKRTTPLVTSTHITYSEKKCVFPDIIRSTNMTGTIFADLVTMCVVKLMYFKAS